MMTVLHPVGEGQRFRFECAGGAVGVMPAADRLTPYGGAAAWSHYLEKLGVVSDLAQRFPVPRTSPNATPVADVLQAFPGKADAPVSTVARPAVYVPETMKAIDLLVELQADGNHLAVVVDEYGGAVGVVTVEDLLETIVGDIDDEYDDEPSPIRQEKPGVWRVEAKIPVAKLNQALDLGIPESDDYETVAGFLIERFRRIPTPGSLR